MSQRFGFRRVRFGGGQGPAENAERPGAAGERLRGLIEERAADAGVCCEVDVTEGPDGLLSVDVVSAIHPALDRLSETRFQEFTDSLSAAFARFYEPVGWAWHDGDRSRSWLLRHRKGDPWI